MVGSYYIFSAAIFPSLGYEDIFWVYVYKWNIIDGKHVKPTQVCETTKIEIFELGVI